MILSGFWIAHQRRPIHDEQNVSRVVSGQFDGGRFDSSANVCLAANDQVEDPAPDLPIRSFPHEMYLSYRAILSG
jgi:hypothetical protein